MKVGIVQNKVIYGGRLAVLSEIIKLLNERGIIPDLLTFQTNITKKNIQKKYGINIDFHIKRVRPSSNKYLPHEMNIIFFGLCLKGYAKYYDYFINSNNTSFLMPSSIPILSYVHFPRKARLRYEYISIHDPSKNKKNWRTISGICLKLCNSLYNFSRKIHRNNFIITNSIFSKKNFVECYPNYRQDIPVIYPPVRMDNSTLPWEEKKNTIVTIGRFCVAKRQFEQIKLAKKLPELTFHIIGFITHNKNYYLKCKKFIKKNNITNVFLHTNISGKQKNRFLNNSKYFLHTSINEPFGITAVEGINAGCIPLVHNSGGQKEIVLIEQLRYKELNDLIALFKQKSLKESLLKKWNQELITHCKNNFSIESFRKLFSQKLDFFEKNFI